MLPILHPYFRAVVRRTICSSILVSAVSVVSAKASIGISVYQQKCGIGPSLMTITRKILSLSPLFPNDALRVDSQHVNFF